MAVASLFLVALTQRWLQPKDIPQNATVLVMDWESNFNPIHLLSRFAPQVLGQSENADWEITDRIVEADTINRALLRKAAKDPEIVEAFQRCGGTLLNPSVKDIPIAPPGYVQTPIRELLSKDYDHETDVEMVGTTGIPVLLGIIIEATVAPGVTYNAQDVWVRAHRPREPEGPGGEPNA